MLDDHRQLVFGSNTYVDAIQTIDFAGRSDISKHNFNNSGDKNVAQLKYNAKSLIDTLKLGYKNNNDYLETCDYTYLDNQWLQSMDGTLFDYTIYYNSSPQTPGQLQKTVTYQR